MQAFAVPVQSRLSRFVVVAVASVFSCPAAKELIAHNIRITQANLRYDLLFIDSSTVLVWGE
jgi:hypothetical protein